MIPLWIDVPGLDDAPAMAAVHVRGWRAAYGTLLPERFYGAEALQRRTEMWARILTEWPRGVVAQRLRVARDPSGAPIGLLLIGPARSAATDDRPLLPAEELQVLYVVRDWHGAGVAQALVTELLGERPAYLWVAEDNPRARRFYEKVGFRPDGATKVDPDLEELREIRMRR